ncbi:MAG: MFS transporter, partial [Planctomycetota bacterium]
MNIEPPSKNARADPYPIRGFWALVATQFQGAFNDNAFKTLITLYLLAFYTDDGVRRLMIPLATALFTVPFLLFSMYSGALSDRNSKKRVIVWAKWFEILIMLSGLVGFFFRSPPLLLATLFLMATQSTLFSPSKYGILPEILHPRKLSWGNGIIQMGTFIAIISGTAASAFLIEWLDTRIYLASVILVLLSVAGLATSFGVTRPPAADPVRRIEWWPWAGLGRYMNLFLADKRLLLTMVGIAYFWFMGMLLQQNIFLIGKETMDLSQIEIGFLLTSLAFGIGMGSFAAGYLSAGKIEVGLIPLGALGLAVFSMLLAVEGHGFGTIMTLLFCLGLSGGFYIIPLSANLQKRSPDYAKGGMIATTNFFTFAGMTISAGMFYVLTTTMKLSPHTVFLISGIMTVAVGGYLCVLLPVFLVRFLLWLLTHTMYRIRVDGSENIPETGGALFVCNHMSTVDAFLVMASTDRLVRFIVAK